MYNYDKIQLTADSRRQNDIRVCKVVGTDPDRGLEFELPIGGTCWIKPMDYEVIPYNIGDFIDMQLCIVHEYGYASLRTARFIGKTPDVFIPSDKD